MIDYTFSLALIYESYSLPFTVTQKGDYYSGIFRFDVYSFNSISTKYFEDTVQSIV
jgi:hypothetical protein